MVANNKKKLQKAKDKTVVRKKKKNFPSSVKTIINASYNNTIVSIVDFSGNVLINSSCGLVGFTGSRKSTAYASTRAAEEAAKSAMEQGVRETDIIIKGIGIGRQAAIKGVKQAGMKIISLSDHTPVPHGGVKPRRKPKK